MGTLRKIFKFYKRIQPSSHVLKEKIWTIKYLKFKGNGDKPRVGVMRVDGRGYHGGLTDRFKGAVSWFNYCESHGIDFRIFYVYPFNLTDYVVPNEYDWRIEEKDIPDGMSETRIFYARGEKGRRLERLNTKKSIWYYGNMDLGKSLNHEPYDRPWGKIFKKLFRPSDLLSAHLKICHEQIGGDYVAAVYRFQNLLGDFNEYQYKQLRSEEEKRKLMAKAIEELDKIHEENPGMRVLVTSDSHVFLSEASTKSYVYFIPGTVEHMDCTDSDTEHVQLKSFLDFFMISEARKVYSITIGKMYRSQFPEYAAKINDVPFIRRDYKS